MQINIVKAAELSKDRDVEILKIFAKYLKEIDDDDLTEEIYEELEYILSDKPLEHHLQHTANINDCYK